MGNGQFFGKELAAFTTSLAAHLNVSLPGRERHIAQALVDAAHQVCPYSHVTRGNIDVAINLV
jgi:lipoyl-dependent peroxiredoxin